MTEAAKAARREYMKKWQRENRDKIKAAQARYWDKKAREAEAQQMTIGEICTTEPQEGNL